MTLDWHHKLLSCHDNARYFHGVYSQGRNNPCYSSGRMHARCIMHHPECIMPHPECIPKFIKHHVGVSLYFTPSVSEIKSSASLPGRVQSLSIISSACRVCCSRSTSSWICCHFWTRDGKFFFLRAKPAFIPFLSFLHFLLGGGGGWGRRWTRCPRHFRLAGLAGVGWRRVRRALLRRRRRYLIHHGLLDAGMWRLL
jgi:hypothetical protein